MQVDNMTIYAQHEADDELGTSWNMTIYAQHEADDELGTSWNMRLNANNRLIFVLYIQLP